ncbi:MAG: phosphodiester glycosidase family protein [Armatimonadetes bacterium]|nr:phosphodiester glycosidase family protein [Armatimonadota bacterium]
MDHFQDRISTISGKLSACSAVLVLTCSSGMAQGAPGQQPVANSHVRLSSQIVAGKKCSVIWVSRKVAATAFDVELAPDFPNGDTEFKSFLSDQSIVAAINGAYFDKLTRHPIGDIWKQGELKYFGAMGTAFCVGRDGRFDIRRVERSRHADWSKQSLVVACGPALVLDGKVDCDWQSEGFRDPSVIVSTPRMGIGYTQDQDLLLVSSTSATFEEFAQVMHKLG